MVTASDIIRRTLRLLGVIDANTAMQPEDAQDALDTLNAMLAEWYAAGIGLPDYSLSSLTDELATDAADREAVAYQLGLRIAPEYGVSLSPEYAAMAEAAMGRMRLRYFQPGTVDFDLPTTCNDFNITTGQ